MVRVRAGERSVSSPTESSEEGGRRADHLETHLTHLRSQAHLLIIPLERSSLKVAGQLGPIVAAPSAVGAKWHFLTGEKKDSFFASINAFLPLRVWNFHACPGRTVCLRSVIRSKTTENYVKGKKKKKPKPKQKPGDASHMLHPAPGKFSRGMHI